MTDTARLKTRLVERFNDRLLRRADHDRFLSMIQEVTGADHWLAEWLLWNETPYPFGQGDDVSDAIAALLPVRTEPGGIDRTNY